MHQGAPLRSEAICWDERQPLQLPLLRLILRCSRQFRDWIHISQCGLDFRFTLWTTNEPTTFIRFCTRWMGRCILMISRRRTTTAVMILLPARSRIISRTTSTSPSEIMILLLRITQLGAVLVFVEVVLFPTAAVFLVAAFLGMSKSGTCWSLLASVRLTAGHAPLPLPVPTVQLVFLTMLTNCATPPVPKQPILTLLLSWLVKIRSTMGKSLITTKLCVCSAIAIAYNV